MPRLYETLPTDDMLAAFTVAGHAYNIAKQAADVDGHEPVAAVFTGIAAHVAEVLNQVVPINDEAAGSFFANAGDFTAADFRKATMATVYEAREYLDDAVTRGVLIKVNDGSRGLPTVYRLAPTPAEP